MKNNKQNFYDKIYSAREPKVEGSWLFNKLKRFEKYREEVVIELLPKKINKILDVACGEGTLVFKVFERAEESWGIDISNIRVKRAVSKAKELKSKNVYFKLVDFDQGLPFEDQCFDVVTAVAALAFSFDPYFIVSEIKRVLKKSGTLVLQVPNLAYFPRRITLILGKQPWTSNAEGWDGGHLHYFTQGSLRKFLEDSGFKLVKTTGSGIFANLRNWYPSLLSGDLIIKAIKIK